MAGGGSVAVVVVAAVVFHWSGSASSESGAGADVPGRLWPLHHDAAAAAVGG